MEFRQLVLKYTLILNDTIFALTPLFSIFNKSATNDKRRLIGLISPEKFDFKSLQRRTAEMTGTPTRIYLINNKLEGKKRGQKIFENPLPCEGSATVRNSNRFVDELIEIGGFSKIL